MIMRILLRLLLVFSLLPGAAMAHAWLKIKIATSEYPPYTSSDMEHNGYINHIISEAFLQTGVLVEFESMPWEEAVQATLAGEFDALSYGNFVRARETDFWHSDPVSTENLVFYTSSDSGISSWSSLAGLSDYRMGVTRGYLYTDELASYIQSARNVVPANTDEQNLQALMEQKIDLFPIDELTGWYLLQRDFSEGQRELVTPVMPYISTVTTHLLIPRGGADDTLILALFNKGLQELTLQGKMQRFKRLLREGFYQNPEKPVNFDRR